MTLEDSCLESKDRTLSIEGKKWLMNDFREATTCGRFLGGLTLSRPCSETVESANEEP